MSGNGETDTRQFWPRKAAAMICRQPTREARASMLLQVPIEFRDWVKLLVTMHFERKRHAKAD